MKQESSSELRQDLVSGDWVVVAPKRGLRPDQFAKKEKRIKAPQKDCPFENPVSDPDSVLALYSDKKNSRKNEWEVAVIKNKFPAFTHKPTCAQSSREGPYAVLEGRGYQDIVVTKDHDTNFPDLKNKSAYLIFRAFQDRLRVLSADHCLAYVSIFQNWGPKAGASVYHPHYQIIAIPVVPPDVEHSLSGSLHYFRKHKSCVHCLMMKFEKEHKKRIVAENKGAIAFAPFVSREPFEIRIFPKKHLPYLEDSSESDLKYVVDILQESLAKIKKKLNDPDYNFFIHTAPVLNKAGYRHYHWHIEILPKLSIWAGFELGTGIDITVVDPDEAAKILTS